VTAPPLLSNSQHSDDRQSGPLGAAGLAVLASAGWPAAAGGEPPAIAGFITSSFSPLVAVVAEACLRSYFGPPPGETARTQRTAIVLASATGDIGTAAAVGQAVDAGRRVPPLLFYQSSPNAVAGYIAARWGLAGPVVCTIPAGDALADALASATLLIEDGDAAAALVIVANQGSGATDHGATDDGATHHAATHHGATDHGTALLVGPSSWSAGGLVIPVVANTVAANRRR
jgi:hypothetical protein